MSKLSHIDSQGKANMVDVGAKDVTSRTATAEGRVVMKPETLKLILEGDVKKGDVLGTARLAGIMAAKKTSDLIPLCHPLGLSSVNVDLTPDPSNNAIRIRATAKVTGQTGVEMEALTAVSVAALTIYDMAKAVDREMEIGDIRLIEKEGGKSGSFKRPDEANTELRFAGSRSSNHKAKSVVRRAEEVAPDRAPTAFKVPPPNERDAFRQFIRINRIQIHRWAKDADVKPGEVFAYLNGQTSRIPDSSAQKLAAAIGVSTHQMFGH